MFIHNIDPVLFRFFGLEIRYYGVIYVAGIIISLLYTQRKAKERKLKNTDENIISDFFLINILALVAGARLFHVLFYEFAYYLQYPLQIFAVWRGGLSFHGGLAGILIASFLFCKKKKINLLELGDIVFVPVALALCIGRIANFINGELYGIPTNLPWAVQFYGSELARHPTQIYESLKNLLIFLVLFKIDSRYNGKKSENYKKTKLRHGTIIWMFLLLYGVLRFFIEFLKDFPKVFIGLNMGQILSLAMIITGAIMLWLLYKPKKQKPKKNHKKSKKTKNKVMHNKV